MVVCKQCGVELDNGMEVCPLCETPVIEEHKIVVRSSYKSFDGQTEKSQLLKSILWQIACVLLLSGTLSTLIINVSIEGRVTWSMYPAAICLIVLSYAAFIALWRTNLVIRIVTAWVASSALLLVVQLLTVEDWPLSLALPIVSAVTILSICLMLILSHTKVKGLNILAILFVGIAIVCLIIEGILSLYFKGKIQLGWSVVVSACLLPVTAAIVFMYIKTRNNSDLQKIFHT